MKLYKLNILLCSALILLVAVINVLIPKTETISTTENRTLAKMPDFSSEELFSGDYFKAYDAYFSDHFIGRDRLVSVAKDIQTYSGVSSDSIGEIVINHGENVIGDHSGKGGSGANAANPTNIFYLKDRAMTLYKHNAQNANAFVESYNRTVKSIPENIKVSTFLVPDQIEFSTLESTAGLSDSQKDALDFFKEKLDPKTIFVNALPSLEAHKSEYIYFRTDHHWTARGAYYGYIAYAKAHGFEPEPLENFKAETQENFLGSRYKLNTKLGAYPDAIEYFKHPDYKNFKYQVLKEGAFKSTELINPYFLKTESKYAVFMGGDHPVAIIESGVKNGETLMVLKDSFANAFVPFLAPHYEKIVILDPRHQAVNLMDAIKKYSPTEILFLNTIHSASKTLNQQFDQYIKS